MVLNFCSRMELAISTLKKAVELDQNENYVQSLQLYQKGIQMLLNLVTGKNFRILNYLFSHIVTSVFI